MPRPPGRVSRSLLVVALCVMPLAADEPDTITPGGMPCAFSGFAGSYRVHGAPASAVYENISTDGDLAVFSYFADSFMGIIAIDVSDPANPKGLGGVATDEPRTHILRDDLLYLHTDGVPDAIRIYDFSDPSAAVQLGSVETGAPTRMALGDTLLFTLVGDSVHAIDISSPSTPSEAFTIDLGYNLDDIAADSDLLYLLDGNSGLTVYDCSSPANPRQIGYTVLPCVFTNSLTRSLLAVDGDRLVISGLLDLALVDISDPASPAQLACVRTRDVIGSFRDSGNFKHPTLHAGVLYLRDTFAGLVAIDWTNPAEPALKGQQDTPGFAQSAAFVGEVALVADAFEGISIIDTRSLNAIQPLRSLLGFHPTVELSYEQADIDRDVAYLVGYDSVIGEPALMLADVSDPDNPDWITSYSNGLDDLTHAKARGGVAFLATGKTGLEVVDCRNPHNPTLVFRYQPTFAVRRLAMDADRIALADNHGPVVVLGITDPLKPRLDAVVFPRVEEYQEAFTISGTVLYLAGEFDNTPAVETIDISNPLRPVSSVTMVPVEYDRIAVDGGRLYAINGDEEAGLFVSRVDDLDNPTLTALSWFEASGLDVSDGYVYLASYYGLRMYEVTDPYEPATLVGCVTTRDEAYGIRVVGDTAYASGGSLEIINVDHACGHCPGDFNSDGAIDFFDIAAFLDAYHAQSPNADLDGNSVFDFFDVAAYLGTFVAGCS